MDTSGCPAGWFTDRILVYRPPTEVSCESPVAVWLVLNIVLFLARVMVTETRDASKSKNKFSKGALAGYSNLLAQALFFTLTSANVANTINSGSGVLFGLYALTISLNHLVYMRKMVALGSNIIPLSRRVRTTLEKENRFSGLQLVDRTIQLFMIGAVTMTTAIVIVFVIGAIGFPNQFWPFEVAMALVPTYQLMVGNIAVWQIQRCKNALWRMIYGESKIENEELAGQVKHAWKTMTKNQVAIVCCVIPTAVLCILFAIPGLLPMTWWLFVLTFLLGDTLMVFLVNAQTIIARCRRGRGSSSKGDVSGIASSPAKVPNRTLPVVANTSDGS